MTSNNTYRLLEFLFYVLLQGLNNYKGMQTDHQEKEECLQY